MRLVRRFILTLTLVTVTAAASADAGRRTFAVRTPPGADALAAAVRDGGFQRWFVPSNDSVTLAVGPEAAGDVVVEAQVFPADERVAAMLAGLPVAVRGDALVVAGTPYPASEYALAVRLPEAPKPTWVVIGHDAATAAALADHVLLRAAGARYRRGPAEDVDYLVYENPYSQRGGRWQRAAGGGWTVDPGERDDMAARAAAYAALVALERPRVTLRVPPADAADPAYGALADALDAAVREMAPRVPTVMERPLEILVEADFVAQGRHLGEIGEAVLDARGRLHLVFHPDDLGAYRYGVARALARRAGPAPPPWLEDGAALWLAGRWYGRAYAAWLPDFAAADVLPGAEELLAAERQDEGSAVLWPPVAAAVIDRLPGATLRDKLRAPPSPVQVAAALKDVAGLPVPKLPAKRSVSGGAGFQAGVSLAMANGLEVGYHAPGVDEQLARLALMGVDSVSLMPFAGSAPHEPRLRFYNRGPGSETDVGLIHAARLAHSHGMRVLWKPHLWVSHDSWPGDIAMTSEADWAAWWRAYRRYVAHHAVLAEWTGSELFSIGVELGRTLEHEAEWRALIAGVRRVYSGRLTYSGNWWGDYDRVPFWDALDDVGVDAYFPLAEAGAGRAALAAGARRAVAELAAAAARFGRPVILTEVGFAARKGAWVAPHEEGGEYDEGDQELAYEALLEALGRPPWLAGVYFWKVFSHPSIEGGERPSFQFLGRAAEAAVRGYLRPAMPAVSTPQ